MVLSGTLRAVVDGEERSYGAGAAFTVPPGTPHEMWSEEEGVRVDWQTRPALRTEEFFEAVWGLAREGRTDERGRPGLLQAAAIARAYADEFRLAGPPWPVQMAVFGALAPVGRLLGCRAPAAPRRAGPVGSPRDARLAERGEMTAGDYPKGDAAAQKRAVLPPAGRPGTRPGGEPIPR